MFSSIRSVVVLTVVNKSNVVEQLINGKSH